MANTTATAAAVQPTSGNTWVERTDSDDGHESQTSALAVPEGKVMCDYLRIRFPHSDIVWQGLRDWLGVMQQRPCGWRSWYTSSACVLDGGLVAWCDDEAMQQRQGILCDLPGRAVGALGDRLMPFLEWSLSIEGAKVTRMDYCLDDYQGRITRERILEAEASGALVSRAHGLTEVVNWQKGKIEGWCIYIGSRSSESLFRVYDKQSEQKKGGRGRTRPAPDASARRSWIRLEFETKSDFADRLARQYLVDRAGAVIGQINRRLRFAVPSETDTNPRRWATAAWWQEFIGSIEEGAALCAGKVVKTIEAITAWVEYAVGPSLATLMEAWRDDLGPLLKIIRDSRHRVKPAHRVALALAGV